MPLESKEVLNFEEEAVDECIRSIREHGLLSKGSTGFTMHRLIQQVIRQPLFPEEQQTHISFTATIVSAFSKDEQGKAFAVLCANPEHHSIPAPLGAFIQRYVKKHPKLRELSTYPDFAGSLKSQLLNGKIEELYARFGVPKPEQAEPKQGACAMM